MATRASVQGADGLAKIATAVAGLLATAPLPSGCGTAQLLLCKLLQV